MIDSKRGVTGCVIFTIYLLMYLKLSGGGGDQISSPRGDACSRCCARNVTSTIVGHFLVTHCSIFTKTAVNTPEMSIFSIPCKKNLFYLQKYYCFSLHFNGT